MSRDILGSCIVVGQKRNFKNKEYVCFHFSIYVSVPCDHMNISKSSFWVNLLGFSVQRYEQITYCICINLKGNFFFIMKNVLFAVTVKQPIVFSKQPIVFPLTPLYNAAKFAYA